MFPLSSKQVCNAVLAVLLVLNCIHCCYGESEAMQRKTQRQIFAAHQQTLPWDNQQPACHNESGCICRGATLVDSFDAKASTPTLTESALDFAFASGLCECDGVTPSSKQLQFARLSLPPLAGKSLRTQFVSFLN